MSAEPAPLIPTGRFWVVRLGNDGTFGPFRTERMADWFAAHNGRITSNFIILIRSVSDLDGEAS